MSNISSKSRRITILAALSFAAIVAGSSASSAQSIGVPGWVAPVVVGDTYYPDYVPGVVAVDAIDVAAVAGMVGGMGGKGGKMHKSLGGAQKALGGKGMNAIKDIGGNLGFE